MALGRALDVASRMSCTASAIPPVRRCSSRRSSCSRHSPPGRNSSPPTPAAAGRRMFTDERCGSRRGSRACARARRASSACPEPAFALARARCGPLPPWRSGRASKTCAGRSSSRSSKAWDGRPPSSSATSPVGSSSYEGVQPGSMPSGGDRVLPAARPHRDGSAEQLRSSLPSCSSSARPRRLSTRSGRSPDQIEAGGDMAWVFLRARAVAPSRRDGRLRGRPRPRRRCSQPPATSVYRPGSAPPDVAAAAFLLHARTIANRHTHLLTELDRDRGRRRHPLPSSSILPAPAAHRARPRRHPARPGSRGRSQPRHTPAEHALLSAATPNSPKPPATTTKPPPSTPTPPSAGTSSATSPNAPTPSSATAAASIALGDPAADVPLAEARDLFTSMGYKPALAETEKLLAETLARTA